MLPLLVAAFRTTILWDLSRVPPTAPEIVLPGPVTSRVKKVAWS